MLAESRTHTREEDIHSPWSFSVSCLAAAKHCGLKNQQIQAAFDTFKGIKRRMEIKGIAGGITIVDDFGRSTITDLDLTTWGCGRESYSILPDDPLSARQECHWTEERSRGDWKARTETYSAMTATATHWHVTGHLEAFENDRLVLTRQWDTKVKRKLN